MSELLAHDSSFFLLLAYSNKKKCNFAGCIIRNNDKNQLSMKNMKIVVLDGYSVVGESSEVSDSAWQSLKTFGDVTVYDRTAKDQTVDRSANADIVLTNKVIIGREEMERLPNLKYIGVLATGYNVVDVEAAHERGIAVTNVPAYSTESVAQMVFAHLLTITNRTEHYALQNRAGRWNSNPDFCYWDTNLIELAGKTFGIVGLGNIGMRVAQIALAFGMKVIALTSKDKNSLPCGIESVGLEELFAKSDVLSLNCPLTDSTHYIVNADTLSLMKPTAIIINTGRGPLVDDSAVAGALSSHRIAAYCADVITQEPPKADNPLLCQSNAFFTPHVAWATKEARERLMTVAVDNVASFIAGNPKNRV